jgi:hypothetical protein
MKLSINGYEFSSQSIRVQNRLRQRSTDSSCWAGSLSSIRGWRGKRISQVLFDWRGERDFFGVMRDVMDGIASLYMRRIL